MEYIIWPAIVLIIAIVFMLVFRPQIASLISNIRRLDLPGVKASTNQVSADRSQRNETSEKLMKVFDNQLLLDREKEITNFMELTKISDNNEKVKILLRYLASVSITLNFEQVYNYIYGSQIELLEDINGKPNGEEKRNLTKYYVLYQERLLGVPPNSSYEEYLNFLVSYELITIKETQVFITKRGRGFLSFMAMGGKSKDKFF